MIVSAIAAMAKNRVIGKEGGLPWRIPEDFKFFKTTTMGHVMVMGRKTFESFGGHLPGRLHIVISRREGYRPEGALVVRSVGEALELAKQKTAEWGEEVFLVGGGEIYKEALPYTDRIYLTEIDEEFEGDTRFPDFDKSVFREVERRPGAGHPVKYDFVTYERTT